MAGVGLDVVVVGDFRRPRVPHPAGGADLGSRVLVPQRHVVHGAAGQGGLDRGQPDERRLVPVGLEHVDSAVADDDAGDAVGGQAVEHRATRSVVGALERQGAATISRPGRTSCTPARSSTVDVVGPLGGEQRAGVHRRRIERIVVAGQQIHRHPDARMASSDWLMSRGASWLCSKTSPATTTNSAPVSAARPQAGDGVTAGRRIPRLRLAVQEVAGHAELPVGGMHETHLGPSPFFSPAAEPLLAPVSLPGIASVGPAADKSGEARRARGCSSTRFEQRLAQISGEVSEHRAGPRK